MGPWIRTHEVRAGATGWPSVAFDLRVSFPIPGLGPFGNGTQNPEMGPKYGPEMYRGPRRDLGVAG
jgi:hypothetical protein